MRIRKNAWKLLGSPFYLPSSSSDFTRNEFQMSTAIVCELSSNPWDLVEFEDYICYDSVANLKEEDEDVGILGKAIITHDVVEPISTCLEEALPSITKSELTSTTEATTVKKKRGRKKKNNNEAILLENKMESMNNKNYCKKTDGKGWYCRREVEHPHDLCNDHKEQLHTYTPSHSVLKSTRNATEKIGENSCLYYYYDGFGPCNGKRREKVESEVVVNDNGYDGGGDDDDTSNLIIARGDEYDNDVLDNHNDGDYCDARVKDEKKEMENLEEEKKKKKVHKKRGRKPIKARSLKSIL